MKVVWCASLLIGLAGAASAAPAPWCGKIDRKIDFRISDGDKFNYTSDAEDTADPDAIVNIVGASCARSGDDSSGGAACQCPLVFSGEPDEEGPSPQFLASASYEKWEREGVAFTLEDYAPGCEVGILGAR